jgi:hypothetical protein
MVKVWSNKNDFLLSLVHIDSLHSVREGCEVINFIFLQQVKGYVQANVSSLPIYVTAPSILICSLLYNLYWYRRTRPSSVAVGGYLAIQASSETLVLLPSSSATNSQAHQTKTIYIDLWAQRVEHVSLTKFLTIHFSINKPQIMWAECNYE